MANSRPKMNRNGTPKMKEKRASVSVYIRAPRVKKSLEISGNEGVFFTNLFLLPSSEIPIPFDTSSGKLLDIDLVMYAEMDGEEPKNFWKCIPIRSFKNDGSPKTVETLFKFAMHQQNTKNNFKQNEDEDFDMVSFKFSNQKEKNDYKIIKMRSGKLKVLEVSNGNKEQNLSSPRTMAIIKISKFYNPKSK